MMSVPKVLATAPRTVSIDASLSNRAITDVPPANSTPSGMPLVKNTKAPARMTTQESTMACQRQRRKSKLVFLKICISDTQRGRLAPRGQLQLKERLRDENRREEIRHQTVEQGYRKTADRTGSKLEEEGDRDQRGDVRVEQSPEHAAEPRVD